MSLSNRLLPLLLLLSLATPAQADWFKDTRGIMGTQIIVELWSDNDTQAKQCNERVMQEMQRINQLMSPYIEKSELAQINSLAARRPVKISNELFGLIQRSIKLSELSSGAFDITFASIGYHYDYRAQKKPSDQLIQKEISRINFRHIQLDPEKQTVRFAKAGVRIDLGGIAKGYAVDNGIQILKDCDIQNALVTAGGDSRIIGNKQGRPWMTGIRDPRNRKKSVVVIPLENTAVSTSGDYERYFIEDGVRHHHIISPATGKSVHTTRSVTILGPDAVTTDGLSTTVFVLGAKKGLALVEQLNGIDAVIIDNNGKIHYSSGLMQPKK